VSAPEVDRLRRLLAALAHRLDDDTAGLSRAPELADARAALDRLVAPGTVPPHGTVGAPGSGGADGSDGLDGADGLDVVDPREAVWLADEVERRWALLGVAARAATARIEEVPSDGAHAPAGVRRLVVRVEGLEPGWTAAWGGATPVHDDAGTPGPGEGAAGDAVADDVGAADDAGADRGAAGQEPDAARTTVADWVLDPARRDPGVTVRVTGRGASGRQVLVARWEP